MNTSKLITRTAAVVAAVFALMTALSSAVVAEEKKPVEIGVIIGLTGPNAVAGTDAFHSMEIAVEEINKVGGVLGRPIELVVEDNEGRPKSGVEAANKLADVDQVPVAVGGYSSGVSLPVAQVLNEKGVVWVTDATTNKLKTVGPYVFNTAGLAEQAVALVDFVHKDKPEATRFAGLFANNPIGQDRAAGSKKRAKELGLEWVHVTMYQVGGKDFRAELNQLVASNSDAILTDIYDNDAKIIQRQLFEMGVTDMSQFYSYNLGAYGTLEPKLINGMKGLSFVAAGPRAEDFNAVFREEHGRLYTDPWSPPFYDAMWIVANAINLANSLDPEEIRDAMWPAAYHYLGVSGSGDKGMNQYGMQATDTHAQQVYKEGELTPYYIGGGDNNVITYRYEGELGVARRFAPSEEEFKQLYSASE